MIKKIACSWSGGKDSCYALMLAKAAGYESTVLLNVMNEKGKISRSHGLPEAILAQQAGQMNLPLETVASSWQNYEVNFISSLKKLKKEYEIEAVVFGDIDLQEHRDWEEKVCAAAGLTAILPLWQMDRNQAAKELVSTGIVAQIVSCNMDLGQPLCGRVFDEALITELERMGIDACGEGGEFHTVVENCELFAEKITLPSHKSIIHENYCFLDWGV